MEDARREDDDRKMGEKRGREGGGGYFGHPITGRRLSQSLHSLNRNWCPAFVFGYFERAAFDLSKEKKKRREKEEKRKERIK